MRGGASASLRGLTPKFACWRLLDRGIVCGIFSRVAVGLILRVPYLGSGRIDRVAGFKECFSGLADPRPGNARRHDLLEILLNALCTVLCGGESCVGLADFAVEKAAFLGDFSL
jgi:hypothetical protein